MKEKDYILYSLENIKRTQKLEKEAKQKKKTEIHRLEYLIALILAAFIVSVLSAFFSLVGDNEEFIYMGFWIVVAGFYFDIIISFRRIESILGDQPNEISKYKKIYGWLCFGVFISPFIQIMHDNLVILAYITFLLKFISTIIFLTIPPHHKKHNLSILSNFVFFKKEKETEIDREIEKLKKEKELLELKKQIDELKSSNKK